MAITRDAKARCLVAVLFAAAMNVASSAHALLLDRGPDMVYDNVLNITWTRQAGDGVQRNWADAKSWAANLVVDGISGWRLPYVSVTAGDGPATTVVDCLFATEQVCRGNEYGYMYYWNLGGSFGSDLTGTHTAIGGQVITGIQPLTFQVQEGYWSATGFNPNLSWLFFYFPTLAPPRRSRVTSGHSTVTDFARFLGLSTSVPRSTAVWYARSCSGIVCTTGDNSPACSGSRMTWMPSLACRWLSKSATT